MNIRLIAVDLDGTLLMEDHIHVSERNKRALEAAKQQGIIVAIATGRTVSVLTNVVAQVPFMDYVLTSNGASAMSLSDQAPMFLEGIPYELWCRICKILRKYKAVFELYCNGKSYMDESLSGRYKSIDLDEEFIEELRRGLVLCKDVISELKSQPIEKINVLCSPEEGWNELFKEICDLGGLTITTSIPGNMELNHEGVNKGRGLKNLCDSLGIAADEVMVFGDANNDLEMLSWAKYSYAMKNGSKEAKDAAHFETEYTNAEDGVARVVESCLQKKRISQMG